MTQTTENKSIEKVAPINTEPATDSSPIIFFDGVCGLCNHFVDFVLDHDSQDLFLFAPLQGISAESYLPEEDVEELKSVVLWDSGKTYRKSTAVVRILQKLNGIWWLLGWLFWFIPWPLRDVLYTIVAKLRYRLFGKREMCRFPTPEEEARFLN